MEGIRYLPILRLFVPYTVSPVPIVVLVSVLSLEIGVGFEALIRGAMR